MTDGLGSHAATLEQLELSHLHHPGRLREHNRAENSHLPIRKRERHMQGFKSQGSAQRFLTVHFARYNTFHTQRQLVSGSRLHRFRAAAPAVWILAVT